MGNCSHTLYTYYLFTFSLIVAVFLGFLEDLLTLCCLVEMTVQEGANFRGFFPSWGENRF
jgi:hypothetical protein